MDIFHYVYKLTHTETKEFYFGSRTSKVHPTLDSYMGSMLSWKPNKYKLIKEIIKTNFYSREDCIGFERQLIIENKDNLLNRNAHIPGVGFHTTGVGLYVHIKTGKTFRLNSNDDLLKTDEYKLFWLDRTHSEESKKKMSESAKNRTIIEKNELKRRNGISKNNKKPKSKEHIENIRKAKLGSKNPMYGKRGSDNPRSKPCFQYDKEMNLINKWDNGKIAANKLGLSYSSINHCLGKKIKSSGGFIWKYE